jgi:hypothetical protein
MRMRQNSDRERGRKEGPNIGRDESHNAGEAKQRK